MVAKQTTRVISGEQELDSNLTAMFSKRQARLDSDRQGLDESTGCIRDRHHCTVTGISKTSNMSVGEDRQEERVDTEATRAAEATTDNVLGGEGALHFHQLRPNLPTVHPKYF